MLEDSLGNNLSVSFSSYLSQCTVQNVENSKCQDSFENLAGWSLNSIDHRGHPCLRLAAIFVGMLYNVHTMKICRWKWYWKITATLKFNITKGNAALKIFQCYLSVIFSFAFVWYNEDDSRIGFSHNNNEPNRIIIGSNFQCDYKRFDVVIEWLKI